MGGIWQRLAVSRRPVKQVTHPRWDNSAKARTRSQPRPFRALTATQKLADNVKDRSLFRALLREATYFPDEQARSYIRTQVRSRFLRYRSNAHKQQQDPDFKIRLIRGRAKGRQHLHMLQRANSGDTKALLHVLLLTYGREGKRKRVLINELRDQEGHEQASSVPGDAPPQTRAGHWVNYAPALTPRLRALVISQRQTPLEGNIVARVRKVKKLAPVISELNSWHRPMPLRRVKRMTEKWWADLLDRTLPPLQTDEWLRLLDLAVGRRRLEAPKRRGGVIKGIAHPLVTVITSRNGRLQCKNDLHRTITRRAMKRALTEVFRICPHLHQDDGWVVTWGAQALHDPSIGEGIRTNYERSMSQQDGSRQNGR